MKIINSENTDYHIHSCSFSDGTATIEEIVKFAGDIGMEEIAITDHSDVMTLFCIEEKRFFPSVNRNSIKSSRWQNVHNDVKVIFGVEADLLDIDGNICDTIQGKESDFVILSVHKNSYSSDIETITQGLVNAIKKHSEKIKIIGHSYDVGHSGDIDMIKLVEVCNEYNIALELNGKSLLRGDCDISKLEYMLKNANNIYVNSDGHSLYEMVKNREAAWNYLRENGYIN